MNRAKEGDLTAERTRSNRAQTRASVSTRSFCLTLAILSTLASVRPARSDWFAIADESIAEHTLNTATASDQDHATVAIDSAGAAIASWHSKLSSGLEAIYSIVEPDGARLDLDPPHGNFEDPVSSSMADDRSLPDVVTSRGADGADLAIVTWSSRYATTNTFDTHVGLFDASGPLSGTEHEANGTQLSHHKTSPDAAIVRCGDEWRPCHPEVGNGWFVVVWAHTTDDVPPAVEILSRAYDDSGAPLGDGPIRLNNEYIDQTTPSAMILPDVAVNSRGSAVAVWESIDHSTTPPHTALRYCEFSPFFGSPVSCATDTAVQAPQTVGDGQIRPSVDITDDGDLLIAWSELPMSKATDSLASSWFWRRSSQDEEDGPFHVDFEAESPDPGHHLVVARFVEDDPDHLVMAWTYNDDEGDGDIFGREVCLTETGAPDPVGPDAVVLNEWTHGDQKRPALDYGYVESLDATRVWVTWESADKSGASGSLGRYDIRGRSWDVTLPACE